jgi:hypothetical protein
MSENELAELRLERKAVHPPADGQDDHRRRAVDRVSSTDLLRPRLQEVLRDGVVAWIRSTQNRENATDREVHVDVRRTVERVEHQEVLAARIALRDGMRCLQLLGHHPGEQAAPFVGAQEKVVRDQVEFLLRLALDIGRRRRPEHTAERTVGNPLGDRPAGERNVENKGVQFPGRARMAATLLDQELGERRTVGEHGILQVGVNRLDGAFAALRGQVPEHGEEEIRG